MNNELISFGGTLLPEASERDMRKIKMGVQREGSEVVKKILVSTIHEQGRALLTKTALENVGALSALEDHLFSIAPLGQERYRQILDAYAFGAVQKILRW